MLAAVTWRMTSPKLRTSGLGRKSYLSAGKSLAISRRRRFTSLRLLLMLCAGVGGVRCWATRAIAVARRRPRTIHSFIGLVTSLDHGIRACVLLEPASVYRVRVMIYEAAIHEDFPVAEHDDA